MSNDGTDTSGVERDRQLMLGAKSRGRLATLGVYTKLSGPGWLQSAITLGGGSLSSSLYLGVLAGFSLMWLQPLAMILGVIMLSAIGYVTLSTGERPFHAINRHVNPVLGWGWALATMAANLVWSLPQFSLGTAALQQNLLPGVFGAQGLFGGAGKLMACGGILAVCIVIVWFYDSGRKGIFVFETLLKIMVGIIMVCFFGVILKMSLSENGLPWGSVLAGLVPDVRMLWSPAKTFDPFLAEVAPRFQDFWRGLIVGQQRDVIISAAATAVGINMTFLLPYSMLRRGWDKDFRGLAVFDLSTGLFVPFILATGCVVIASAAQFHTQPVPGLVGNEPAVDQPAPKLVAAYEESATGRVKSEIGAEAFAALSAGEVAARIDALPEPDKKMAAMLVKRDNFDLAQSLAPLTGDVIAQYVFGVGVIGMAVSSIIILMLINGFVICEMLGLEPGGWPHRLGTLMPAVGALGPFFWKQAAPWLAMPTSVFGMMLIPIAYFTFFLVMNQRTLLGDHMPKGGRRVLWNVLMTVAAGLAAFGSLWSLWSKLAWKGIAIFAGFILLALIVHFVFPRKPGKPAGLPEVES